MGNGKIVLNPPEAMGYFIQTEFPQIHKLVTDGKSHDVIFVPDSYLFEQWTEKVNNNFLK